MPIYEYRCSSCGHELEALQKLSDAPLTTVLRARARRLVKLVSAAGFQLKGSGWYAPTSRAGTKTAPTKEGSDAPADAKVRGKSEGAERDQVQTKTEAATATPLPSRDRGAPLPPASGNPPSRAMKRYVIAGLLVWVPLGITIWVIESLVSTLDQTLLLIPERYRPAALFGFTFPGSACC